MKIERNLLLISCVIISFGGVPKEDSLNRWIFRMHHFSEVDHVEDSFDGVISCFLSIFRSWSGGQFERLVFLFSAHFQELECFLFV